MIKEYPNLQVEIKLAKNPIHLIAAPFLYLAILTSKVTSEYPFIYSTLPKQKHTLPKAHAMG